MYNVAEFVITLYCLIEDEWYPAFLKQHGLPRRAGFAPALSASEGLTIELVGQYLGYSSQKQLYEHRHDRFGAWFNRKRTMRSRRFAVDLLFQWNYGCGDALDFICRYEKYRHQGHIEVLPTIQKGYAHLWTDSAAVTIHPVPDLHRSNPDGNSSPSST